MEQFGEALTSLGQRVANRRRRVVLHLPGDDPGRLESLESIGEGARRHVHRPLDLVEPGAPARELIDDLPGPLTLEDVPELPSHRFDIVDLLAWLLLLALPARPW